MVKIFPFRGILYNKSKLKKLDKVFTPPYDVISPEEQDYFYNVHDFNFIRLILGKEFSGDGQYNNKYVRAAAFFDGWMRHNIIVQDRKPAIYIYEQRFSAHKIRYSRLGFIAVLRLEDMGRGKVYPHEETYSKAKLDRLQLMRSTNCNFESIFSIYSDEKNKINKILKKFTKRSPVIAVTDKDKVAHRLWRIDRKPSIDVILREMKDKAVFIADGHHRYEAALRFKNELKMQNTKFSEDESYNHIMMCFVSLEDKGLLVLPIHRVLSNLGPFDMGGFERQLEQYFDVTFFQATKKSSKATLKKLMRNLEKARQERHAFGLYLGKHRFALLTLKDEKIIDEMVEEEKPKAWKTLDTNILHFTIFDRILGIAQDTAHKVAYTKNAEEAVQMVDEKGFQMAFLLNPTKIEEITAVASKFEKMPQKSTYFYPKLLSGLVFNKIVHGEKVKA